jgi:D-amino peptidase
MVPSVLILSDIEGSSGCWSYAGSSFLTEAWCRACLDITQDVNAVVTALFEAGSKHITIQDFHRTGYNLLPELIDPRAVVRSGYRRGPVPGIGDPGDGGVVMFLGMHAASGTGGFLPHTLTSRIGRLEMNGRPLAEVELFSAALAPFGVRPVFFSGCPLACSQAREAVHGIHVYPIDKEVGPEQFDAPSWRAGLAEEAVRSLENQTTVPYAPTGPFEAVITMRDGEEEARRIARRWDFHQQGARIFLEAPNLQQLYKDLIKLCYFTPLVQKVLPLALLWHRVIGRVGLEVVRQYLKRRPVKFLIKQGPS